MLLKQEEEKEENNCQHNGSQEQGKMMRLESLKSKKDFDKVYRKGKSFADKVLVMYYLKNQVGYTRVGVSVSSKIGNSVVRHRIKRLIKEVFRVNFQNIQGYDIIFIARTRASEADFVKIKNSMNHIIRKLPNGLENR